MVGCPYLDGPAAGGVCWQGCADAFSRGEWRICCKDPHFDEIRLRNRIDYEARFGKEVAP
jgi:hypothetical protein